METVPGALENSKSSENVLIPNLGFALWMNFVLIK